MLELVEIVAVAGERHPGVGTHRQADATPIYKETSNTQGVK
jgi:hypothetical protein